VAHDKSKKDVIFRRIRGRIVPIRVKGRKKEISEGLGLTGLGAGVAVAGGVFARSQKALAKRRIRVAQRAESVLRKGDIPSFKRVGKLNVGNSPNIIVARRLRKGARQSLFKAKISKLGALIFGASLIGSGVSRLFGKDRVGQDALTSEVGKETLTGLAAVGLAIGLRKRIPFKFKPLKPKELF